MNTYTRRMLVIASITSILMRDISGDTLIIPRLDPIQIEQKKEFFDAKCTRIKYMRYTALALLAAGITYLGYAKYTAPVIEGFDPHIPTAHTLDQTVVVQGQDIKDQAARLKVLEGKSWLDWGSGIMNHALLGINLNFIGKIVATPVLGRIMAPLLDIDEFWYQLRSEGDFIKGIISKASTLRRLTEPPSPFNQGIPLNSLTDDDKQYFRCTIQDSVALLAKQIEKIIGFVRHKQGQFKDKNPHVVQNIDNELRYLMISYDEFARNIEDILNNAELLKSDNPEMNHLMQEERNVSASIIECTKLFEQEYNSVKDHIKALEDQLNGM